MAGSYDTYDTDPRLSQNPSDRSKLLALVTNKQGNQSLVSSSLNS